MTTPTLLRGLTTQQAAFVAAYVRSGNVGASYREAGYSCNDDNAATMGCNALRSLNVTAALHSEVARMLAADAVIARRVVSDIIKDDKAPVKVRGDLAIKVLHIAGHVAPRALESIKNDKALSEMTLDELRTASESLQGEIADRAKPINSANPAPVPEEAIDFM